MGRIVCANSASSGTEQAHASPYLSRRVPSAFSLFTRTTSLFTAGGQVTQGLRLGLQPLEQVRCDGPRVATTATCCLCLAAYPGLRRRRGTSVHGRRGWVKRRIRLRWSVARNSPGTCRSDESRLTRPAVAHCGGGPGTCPGQWMRLFSLAKRRSARLMVAELIAGTRVACSRSRKAAGR